MFSFNTIQVILPVLFQYLLRIKVWEKLHCRVIFAAIRDA